MLSVPCFTSHVQSYRPVERNVPGTKRPGNESSRERNVQGTKRPLRTGNETSWEEKSINPWVATCLTVLMKRKILVEVTSDLKPSRQCQIVYNKANKILGMIGRTFSNKSCDVLLQLYKSLVRPNLEYCISAWSPYYEKETAIGMCQIQVCQYDSWHEAAVL